MRRETVRVLCCMLVTSQLLLTMADFAHAETLLFGGFPDTIVNHDCGTKELHKALDSCQPCLPCFRNVHSVALPEAPTVNTPIIRSLLTSHDYFPWSQATALTSISKRGPPALTCF